MSPSLVWFRLDLRVADNPALEAAARRGGPIIPVFIWAPAEEAPWAPGGASRWWLHQSLQALEEDLRQLGSQLVIRRGTSCAELQGLIQETAASSIFWNRRYEPAIVRRDREIEISLRQTGIAVSHFNAALLREPSEVNNRAGRPFQVFTPFWRTCQALPEPPPPSPTPRRLTAPDVWPRSLPISALALEPRVDWAGGLRSAWCPGAKGAHDRLSRFLAESFSSYAEQRDRPDLAGTSRLSPHLHFGEISPRQIWQAGKQAAARARLPLASWRDSRFAAEIGWREFAHHLLFHFPETPATPLREEFRRFGWREEKSWLKAWQRGRTGFPFIDAGLRELWTTGWMHNRVRMAVASFLVKDLLLAWTEGARWFWDTLVDADLAQNTLGWQWSAGCGADAAPYFRIFNPTLQGEKFDPAGAYVRRWIPELARLPDRWIHRPAEAPAVILASAGVELERTYPQPIVRHAIAREIALEAFQRMKSASRGGP